MTKEIHALPVTASLRLLEAPTTLTNEDFEVLITERRNSLRRLERRVSGLLQTPHSSKEAQEVRNHVISLDREITDISDLLDDRIRESATGDEDTKHQKAMLDECTRLIAKSEKMDRRLGDEILACQTKESKPLIPLTSFMFAAGFPSALSTIARGIWGEKSPEIIVATGLGGIAGIGFAFPKQTVKIWRTVSVTACNAPRQVKGSFVVYYVKESVRRKALTAAVTLELGASILTRRASQIPARQYAQAPQPVVRNKLGL